MGCVKDGNLRQGLVYVSVGENKHTDLRRDANRPAPNIYGDK